MTDRPDHRAAAERMLADADEWTAQTGELDPAASELSCLAYGILHALFAIHDTLTAPDRYFANEARQREGQIEAGRCCMHARCPGGSLCCCTKAGPDPLDEDDHRDRLDAGGTRWTRAADGCWANGTHHVLELISLPGPLTFAPEAAQETPRADPSASQDESGAVEGGGAPMPSTRRLSSCVERWPDCASGEYNPACCRFPKSCSPHGSGPDTTTTGDAQKAILCPECDDHINAHNMAGCRYILCDCPRTPEDVVRALIAQAAPVDIKDAR